MSFKERKQHFIEEYMMLEDKEVLNELEKVLHSKKVKKTVRKNGFDELSGVMTASEAKKMKDIIAEGCENIHPDDWK